MRSDLNVQTPFEAPVVDQLSVRVVVPMHCTGAPFIEMMRQRMPDRLVRHTSEAASPLAYRASG